MKTTKFITLGVVLAVVALVAHFGLHLTPHLTLTAIGAAAVPAVFGMILDERSEFADATSLDTGGTGLTLVGDVMDLGVARNVGAPGAAQLYLVIEVDTAVLSGGAATLGFVLASDAQAAIAVDGTASEHVRTPLIAKATLVAGYRYVIAVPSEGDKAYERYLGILQNVGVAALTAGKINAFLTLAPNEWKAKPDAI